MKKEIFLLLALAVLSVGCAQQPITPPTNNPETFTLYKEFAVVVGQKYLNAQKDLILQVVKFTDSTCPKGVECVWQGEQGITLRVSTYGKYAEGEIEMEIYLGLTTKKKDTALGYEIELVAIETGIEDGKKQARIVVRNAQVATNDKTWFAIDGKQCGNNPWIKWKAQRVDELPPGVVPYESANDLQVIKAWLDAQYQIKVFDSKYKKVDGVFCQSCDCPSGEKFAVLVEAKHKTKLLELGFKEAGFCSMEAKLCPDDTAVGREGPFCEFKECPVLPKDSNFSVTFSMFPGLSPNPVIKKAIIGPDGKFVVELEDIDYTGGRDVNTYTGTLSKVQMNEISEKAISSGFFGFPRGELQSCIADAPTYSLEITLGAKNNSVQGIGAECGFEEHAELMKLVNLIDDYTKED